LEDVPHEPLRHDSGHGGSHTFLTREFIDALTHDRRPSVATKETWTAKIAKNAKKSKASNGHNV